MRDLATVFRKEWTELLFRRGRPSVAVVSGLALVLLLGAVIPTITGVILPPRARAFLGSTPVDNVLLYMPLMAAFAVLATVIDTVAGERERHTLETLLATPLSERSILFGKMLAVGTWSSFLGVLVAPVGLLTVRILYGAPRTPLPALGLLAAMTLITALAAALMVEIGSLVSMRVATVRQGQQVMSVLALPLVVAAPLLSTAYRLGWLRNVLQPFAVHGGAPGLVLLSLFVLGLVLVLLAINMAAFRRSRLLLA